MRALTIDPGMENGACLFEFGDDQPFTVKELWQFPFGAPGLAAWLDYNVAKITTGRGLEPYILFQGRRIDHLIVEKFTPWNDPAKEFKLDRKSVEPLRGEGVLIGRGFDPFIEWGEPGQQYFIGSASLPKDEKRKLSKEWLKTKGLYLTGHMVGGKKDAEDAISATLHSIAWLRRKRHMPTLKALFTKEK